MALDEAQRAAVKHNKGPAMILAGPGSGKTTVITHRLKTLTEEYGAAPERILVITFTKMAAVQMKERFLKLCDKRSSEITFGTFHAVFFMMLKNVCHYKASDIIKAGEQRAFVKMFLMAKGISVQDEQNFIGDILSEIAKLKGSFLEVENYTATSCDEELFKKIFVEYKDMLSQEHKVDFEDMMVSTLKVLQERSDVLELWQKRYEYILIDEFQDAAPVQFEVMRLLADRHRNIFVVGDDDQSIYGFRGAAPDVMKNFSEVYKNCAVYHLDINYRSTGNIVKAATYVINSNKNRFFKDLRAFNDDGDKVELLHFDNIAKQNGQVVAYIEEFLEDNSKKETIAVLTRTNSGAQDIISLLSKKGINARIAKREDNIFGHWIALDIVAYVRLVCGGCDRADYIRIINKPMRYISRLFFQSTIVVQDKVTEGMLRTGQTQLVNTFKELCNDLHFVKGMPPYAGFTYIRKKMGYEKYIKEYAKEQGIKSEVLVEVLDKLQESTRQCHNYEQWLELVKNYDIGGQDDNSRTGTKQKAKDHTNVVFCTMHSAKGLEFDTVIIPDANEGITPYSKAITESALEEERRLFYVAMTRARTRLILCYADERHNKYVQPSRYIRELHNCTMCVEQLNC